MIPRWIRCYDKADEPSERYTIVFTRLQGKYPRGYTFYLGASSNPFHPQGIGLTGEHEGRLDWPRYSHLGKRVAFLSLPDAVQRFVLRHYREFWGDKETAYHHFRLGPVAVVSLKTGAIEQFDEDELEAYAENARRS